MGNLEDRLSRVEAALAARIDRDEIVELTARYCRAVASDDVEALVALFTEDGVLESHFPHGSGQDHTETRGVDALRETYRGALGMSLRPCVHNHVVDLGQDVDQAGGFCTLELRLVQDGEPYIGGGHYEDRYRRTPAGWRFSKRKLVLHHWAPHREGWR